MMLKSIELMIMSLMMAAHIVFLAVMYLGIGYVALKAFSWLIG